MSKVDIDIQISGGESTYAAPLFRPGETVSGTVTLFPNEKISFRSIVIQLKWHTEGRGTRFEDIVEEVNVFEGELEQSMPASHEFRFVMPDQPWSYEGHYVSVVWGVSVKIDIPRAKDIHATANIILEPNRGGVSEF